MQAASKSTPSPSEKGLVFEGESNVRLVLCKAILLHDALSGRGPVHPDTLNALSGLAGELLGAATEVVGWYDQLFELNQQKKPADEARARSIEQIRTEDEINAIASELSVVGLAIEGASTVLDGGDEILAVATLVNDIERRVRAISDAAKDQRIRAQAKALIVEMPEAETLGRIAKRADGGAATELAGLSIEELVTVHRALQSSSAAMGAITNEPRSTKAVELALFRRINDLDEAADVIADAIEERDPASEAEWATWGRFIVARWADGEEWKKAQEALGQVRHGMVDVAA